MSYYQRKEPLIKHADLLLSCGCTVTVEIDLDREQPYELGDQFYCRAKHKGIFTVQSVEPWEDIIIE